MAHINKDNLGQVGQYQKHIRKRGKKYRPIFPSTSGIQQNSSDGNEDSLFVDRSNKK